MSEALTDAYVRIRADFEGFPEDVKTGVLKARQDVTIGTNLNDKTLAAKVRASVKEVQAETPDIHTKVDVDDRGVSAAKDAISGPSGLLTAGLALGPALIPIAGALTAAFAAVAVPLLAATAGVGAFAAVAVPQFKAIAKSQKDQKKATDELATAQARLAGAKTPAAKASAQAAVNKALKDQAAAQKELSPAQKAAAASLTQLSDAFKKFQTALAPTVLPVITQGFKLLGSLLPSLTPFAKAAAGALSGLLTSASNAVKSPGFKSIRDFFAGQVASSITAFGHIAGNVFLGLGGLLKGFAPLIKPILGGLVGMSAAFAAFGSGASTSSGFGKFIAYVQKTGPLVLSTFKSLAGAISVLLQGLAPLGTIALQTIGVLANVIGKLPPALITAIAGAILTVVAGIKIWAIAQAALNFVLDANPIGLIIIGLAALAAGLILAYKHSATFRAVVQAAMHAAASAIHGVISAVGDVVSFVKSHWVLIASLLTGPIGAAAIFIVRHFGQIKSGISSAIGGAISFVKGIPGKITKGLGNLGHLLISAGEDVVAGFIQGLKNDAGEIVNAGKALVDKLPGAVKKLLHIASPSKVFVAIGKNVTLGLIKGLEGGASQIKSAAARLSDYVVRGYGHKQIGKRGENHLLDLIHSNTTRLGNDAKKMTSYASQIKTAQTKLTNLKSAASQLSSSVADTINGTFDITQQTTGSAITSGLAAAVSSARVFYSDLVLLKKQGLAPGLLAQLAQAGPAALPAATALLLSTTDIRSVNASYGQLAAEATKTGAFAAQALYGTGISAAEGLIKGLQSKEKAVQAQMDKMAKGMVKSIKKALGIHSPSQVFHDLGKFIPAGLVTGIQAGQPGVGAAVRGLVQIPSLPAQRSNAQRATSGMSVPQRAVQLVVDGRVLAETMINPLGDLMTSR